MNMNMEMPKVPSFEEKKLEKRKFGENCNLFGYDRFVIIGEDIVSLQGDRMEPIYKGMEVGISGGVDNIPRAGFNPDEVVTVVEFREPFVNGSTDKIIKVSNGERSAWLKPSEIK